MDPLYNFEHALYLLKSILEKNKYNQIKIHRARTQKYLGFSNNFPDY